MEKLKPVIFVQGRYPYYKQNSTQQLMLLKALTITQDPKKLKELIGVKTVAEVYRTLDKIAIRKEYHSALAQNGLSFDFITKKLKDKIENSYKDSDVLNGISIFLKSIGMDKYEESAIGGGSWEDLLLKIKEDNLNQEKKEPKIIEYEVKVPEIPEHIRIAKEKANKESKGLYD